MAKKSPDHSVVSGLHSYRPRLEAVIYVLALVGMLVVVHLWIQQERGFDRGCLGFTTTPATEAAFDCEVVVQSGAGSLFGLSNVVWGLLFYLGLGALTALVGFRRGGDVKALKQGRLLLVGAGFAYSLYLIYFQIVQVGEYCALCLISAGIVGILFILHLVDAMRPLPPDAERESKFMKHPVSFYGGLAALILVLAGADVAYFANLPDEPVAPAAPEMAQGPASERGADAAPASRVARDESVSAQCGYNPEMSPVDNWQEMVSFRDPMRGTASAPVTVITYFDPNCPHCKTLDAIMEPVIEEYSDEVRFVFKPFPLWQHSVVQIQALHAAAQEGKFFEMMDRQFQLQRPEGLPLDVLKQIARDIGMDAEAMESRIEDGRYDRVILQDRERGVEAGIRGMPAVLINGRFVAGTSRSEKCLGELIEAAG